MFSLQYARGRYDIFSTSTASPDQNTDKKEAETNDLVNMQMRMKNNAIINNKQHIINQNGLPPNVTALNVDPGSGYIALCKLWEC